MGHELVPARRHKLNTKERKLKGKVGNDNALALVCQVGCGHDPDIPVHVVFKFSKIVHSYRVIISIICLLMYFTG